MVLGVVLGLGKIHRLRNLRDLSLNFFFLLSCSWRRRNPDIGIAAKVDIMFSHDILVQREADEQVLVAGSFPRSP
jgi:hypothetical protein